MCSKVPTQQTTKQHDPKKCITAFKNNKDLYSLKDMNNTWWWIWGIFWLWYSFSFIFIGWFCFWEQVSLCVPAWPETQHINQDHFKFSKICLSLTPQCGDQRHASPCLALLTYGWMGQAYNNQIVTNMELISKQEKCCKEIRHVLILTDSWPC